MSHPQPKPLSLTRRHQSTLDPPNNYFLFAAPEHTSARQTTLEDARSGLVWSKPYEEKKTLSFHPGPENYQLALQLRKGDQGLLTFTVLVGPSRDEGPTADMIPKDTPTEWSVFQIGKGYRGGELRVKDGQEGKSRRWILFKDEDGWEKFGLWDGIFAFAVRGLG
jgi:hypothetical protein